MKRSKLTRQPGDVVHVRCKGVEWRKGNDLVVSVHGHGLVELRMVGGRQTDIAVSATAFADMIRERFGTKALLPGRGLLRGADASRRVNSYADACRALQSCFPDRWEAILADLEWAAYERRQK